MIQSLSLRSLYVPYTSSLSDLKKNLISLLHTFVEFYVLYCTCQIVLTSQLYCIATETGPIRIKGWHPHGRFRHQFLEPEVFSAIDSARSKILADHARGRAAGAFGAASAKRSLVVFHDIIPVVILVMVFVVKVGMESPSVL